MTPNEQHEHTLAGPAICAGVGVHSGERVRLSIRPAPAGHGVVFVRADVRDRDNRVPVSGEAVVDARLNTTIANAEGVTVSTIEHLMAALAALGVSNAVIELDGPELPIMDGSALPFVQLLDRAGFRRQETPQRFIEVLEPIEVVEGDKWARLTPCDRYEMAFEIDFDSAAIGNQRVDFVVDEQTFRDEICAAPAWPVAAAWRTRWSSTATRSSIRAVCAWSASSCGTRRWTRSATSMCSARRSWPVTKASRAATP